MEEGPYTWVSFISRFASYFGHDKVKDTSRVFFFFVAQGHFTQPNGKFSYIRYCFPVGNSLQNIQSVV